MSRLKKGDEVVVIAGKDKGKRGVVLSVISGDNKVIVENINMIKRHTKGNPAQGTPGGIVEKESSINQSNVAIWNPVSNKNDRIGYRYLKDGQKVRYFKSNNEVVDV
jgi:large subunit ribosomal protein L24|tara:strand:- start:1246 stop:1566 length:321 start_codon:yes stop_codon:yes gene_type:complete